MNGDYDPRPVISAGNNWCFVHSLDTLVCPEEDILQNPEGLTELFSEYVKNGADLLLAPTFNLNRFYLESYSAADKMESFNEGIMHLAHLSSEDKIPIGAVLSQYPVPLSPLEDSVDFETLISYYKEQVSFLIFPYTKLFLLDSFSDVRHAKAAVLAVKESCNLPVYVTFSVNSRGTTATDTDILSALITMQSIGVEQFGVCGRLSLLELSEILERLSEYTKIPLIAMPDGIYEDEFSLRHLLSPKEFSEKVEHLLSLSVRLFGVSDRLSPDFVRFLKDTIANTPIPPFSPAKDKDDIVLSSTLRNINFVDVVDDTSEEILCSDHMGDEIIHIENETGGILKILINDEDDLIYFENSSYLINNPVCVSTHSPELLEKAARIFAGTLIFDGTSDIDDKDLDRIKEKYGLIVL